MPPFLTGGEMIESVTRTGAVYAELPHKFEAGTVNAAGAVGLQRGDSTICSPSALTTMHERANGAGCPHDGGDGGYAVSSMCWGRSRPEEHSGIVTFTVDGVHPHDVSEILAADGVCVRAGHHCAQPLLKHLGYSVDGSGKLCVLQHARTR